MRLAALPATGLDRIKTPVDPPVRSAYVLFRGISRGLVEITDDQMQLLSLIKHSSANSDAFFSEKNAFFTPSTAKVGFSAAWLQPPFAKPFASTLNLLKSEKHSGRTKKGT